MIQDTSIEFADLSVDQKKDIRDALMNRIVEDIISYVMVDGLMQEKPGLDVDTLIRLFFEEFDLQETCLDTAAEAIMRLTERSE